MRFYLAGPMTGIHHFNFPAFDEATAAIRGMGHQVWSPAEHDRLNGFDETLNSLDDFDLKAAMAWDLDVILNHVDAVALLPGWEKSKGTAVELAVARAVGREVWFYHDGALHSVNPIRGETILEEAQRLIFGDRNADYGHPIEDFTRTGRMWGAILGTPDVAPEKVGLCMVALKISRECNKAKRDNLVDGAGYFGTVAMVRDRQAA